MVCHLTGLHQQATINKLVAAPLDPPPHFLHGLEREVSLDKHFPFEALPTLKSPCASK